MESRVHLRSKAVRTMSVCMLGQPWPTSIVLTDDKSTVTCRDCVEVKAEIDAAIARVTARRLDHETE